MQFSYAKIIYQWSEFKANAPDLLLLFHIGDFYEAFHEDAISLVRLLGVALTSRDGVPLAGIPFHSIEQNLRRIIATGQKVAICEPIEP